jgi:signal peptidase I
MMRASGRKAGVRASDRPGPRPLRTVARLCGHAAVLACWTLVIVMGLLTWGPHATRYRTDIIVGRSMEPTIPLYSVIVVEPVDPADIHKGDVITYQQPDMVTRKVTHRVHRVASNSRGERTFITKGDNNDVRDPYEVTYADTGYRLRAHVPHIGWLMIKTQTRWARVLLVVLPVLLLTLQFLRWVWRDDEPDEDDDQHDLDEDDQDDLFTLDLEDRRGIVA